MASMDHFGIKDEGYFSGNRTVRWIGERDPLYSAIKYTSRNTLRGEEKRWTIVRYRGGANGMEKELMKRFLVGFIHFKFIIFTF